MENLINNIKEKLSADNLVEMMKDAKVIDENRIKEEDVRETLETVDTENLIDVNELAQKLKEITEIAAAKHEEKQNVTIVTKARSGIMSVLSKGLDFDKPEEEKETEEGESSTEKHPFSTFRDKFSGFLD